MKPLLLLHGALGTQAQMEPLANLLSTQYQIHSLTFTGHGGEAIPAQGYNFNLFVDDIIAYLDKNQLTQVDVFGYSMGGYAAVCAAHKYPNRFGKIITLGTKFNWTPESTERETKLLNPAIIQTKVPAFAAYLQKLHGPQWEMVLLATKQMMQNLSEDAPLTEPVLNSITHPVKVGIGELDTTAGYNDSKLVTSQLANARFWELPNTPHPLEKVDLQLLVESIHGFLHG